MDFEKICMMFTMQEPYYGIILSSMERVPVGSDVCPTMGVTRNGNVFRLLYNESFVSKLDVPTTLEMLKHEVLHLAFSHFSVWEDENPPESIQRLRNIAADLEVNSYIKIENIHDIPALQAKQFNWDNELGAREYFKRLFQMAQQQQQQARASVTVSKPCNGGKGGEDNNQEEKEQGSHSQSNSSTIPQQNEEKQEDDKNNSRSNGGVSKMDNQGNQNNTCSGGGNAQQNEEDEEENEQNSNESQSGNNDEEDLSDLPEDFFDQFEQFDDHSRWPDDDEGTVEQMIDDLLVAAAEETEKGCGTIPSEMRIRVDNIKNKRKPKPVADWKRYVRRYLGNEFSEFIRKSKKRESRRFPDSAGNRHRRKSHILVAIDTSGSVSMPEYLEFFGQIRTLTATATFNVVECDAAIQHTYEFKRLPNMELHGGGGTSFQPVIDLFLENRKKYDALIYFTDGECSVPNNTPKETLWVISSKGNKDRRNDFMKNGANVVFIPKK